MIVTITGMKHHGVKTIGDCLVPGNAVIVERDPEQDKRPSDGCDGLAYRCISKGVTVGYIPLLSTLRGYFKDATTQARVDEIRQRGIATKKVREQLKIENDSVGTESWITTVVTLLYVNDSLTKDKYIEFPQYSNLCQQGKQDGWELCSVGINFDNVEDF